MKKLIFILIVLLFTNILISMTTTDINANNNIPESFEIILLKNENDLLKEKINTIQNNVLNTLDNYPTISPIKFNELNGISSRFGIRLHPIFFIYTFHKGADLLADINTPIYSTINGIVTDITYDSLGYGNKIIISNEKNIKTLYAHINDTILVYVGKYVKKGENIGYVGNTGSITGIHLHYEIYENNVLKDPLPFFMNYLN